jgi:hypothetical protein
VVRLEDPSRGAVVHLVGVSHVLAADAARDVRTILSHHRPDAVVLELCSERAGAAIAAVLARGSRSPPDAPGPRPPGVMPSSVTIEGIPTDRPLPGASPDELLAMLRCKPGRLASPEDIDADVRTLMESGLFEEVLVDVGGSDGDDETEKVMYCAGGECGAGLREVIVGASVAFRCKLDSSLTVTADVRFAWSQSAVKKLGGDPKDLEADVLRRAALLLLEYDKGAPERRHEGSGDEGDEGAGSLDEEEEEEEEETRREGAALRATLREAARRVCAARSLGPHKASVTISSVPPESVWATRDDGEGFVAALGDAGGAVWVSVELVSERTARSVDDKDAGDAMEGSEDRSPGATNSVRGLLRRIVNAASFASKEKGPARAYFAASEIAQEMLAWRLVTADDDGADADATVEGAGDEAVAALAASLEAGVARVVLGDARASATTAAIADAIQSRPGPFPGARLAASTVAAAARMIAFVSPEDLREEIACAAVGERGTLADVAVADWLRDAVVDARDDRMFDAIREAAGYEKVDSGKQTGPPAAAFTLATETPRGLGEGCACYVYEAECTPWVGGPIVVAVVGAAHVDGIVRRWNASLG